jgi:hypothetical protein
MRKCSKEKKFNVTIRSQTPYRWANRTLLALILPGNRTRNLLISAITLIYHVEQV